MKKQILVILVAFCAITLSQCKKDDKEKDYQPSLSAIDISNAKFLIAGGTSDTVEISKISKDGTETPLVLLDEQKKAVDKSRLKEVNFTNIVNNYIGITITWKINSNTNTDIFYLINKTDSKILFSKETGLFKGAYDFREDPGANIYFESADHGLYKWDGSNLATSNPQLIASGINTEVFENYSPHYFLNPQGDIAYSQRTTGSVQGLYYANYIFKFVDGSGLSVPCALFESTYEKDGIIVINVNSAGNFCAFYKNAKSYVWDIRTLQNANGERKFMPCSSTREGDYYYKLAKVRNQFWGIFDKDLKGCFFANLSNCGIKTEYTFDLPTEIRPNFQYSNDYFYLIQGKKIYRYYPEEKTSTLWTSFDDDIIIDRSELKYADDNYALAYILFSPDYSKDYWAFLDNNGKVIAKKSSRAYRAIIL